MENVENPENPSSILPRGFDPMFLSLRQFLSSVEQEILFIAINLYFGAPLTTLREKQDNTQTDNTCFVKCKAPTKICSCCK